MQKCTTYNVIDFMTNYFSNLRIQIIRKPPHEDWFHDIDFGLRTELFSPNTYVNTFPFLPKLREELSTIHIITDPFSCYYILIPVLNEESYSLKEHLVIGPFLHNLMPPFQVPAFMSSLGMSEQCSIYITQYYNTLPIIKDLNCIESLLQCYAGIIYKNYPYNIVYDNMKEINLNSTLLNPCKPINQSNPNLEELYLNEEAGMLSITKGDFKTAEICFIENQLLKREKSYNLTMRDRKNGLIIYNTLFRKAAQRSGIHPIYLDDCSKRFSSRIESIHLADEAISLAREMIHKYCLVVLSHSTKQYSIQIQKVINYIVAHIDEDLGLDALSEKFAFNKSYLSSMFKKETNSTLTNYVTSFRIKHATYLINLQAGTIQSIAIQCGIPNIAYFTKVFKRHMNMTPTQYRDMIHKV